MKMTLKQKLGAGMVGFGLAGAIFFGVEHLNEVDNINGVLEKLEQSRSKEIYSPNKLQNELLQAEYKGLVSLGLYTASVTTVFGGATLVLLDKLKKEWRKK